MQTTSEAMRRSSRSVLEEDLEQLKVLENGYRMKGNEQSEDINGRYSNIPYRTKQYTCLASHSSFKGEVFEVVIEQSEDINGRYSNIPYRTKQYPCLASHSSFKDTLQEDIEKALSTVSRASRVPGVSQHIM
ncbi:hypothetical protein CASFOL_004197 [Castilleja foliolosa]|uniref:Uncharacterized protein n=1 Tax=Castilleja foliolosa TaxID=1961234 RepID=A0ABD3E9Q0_9LAMI